MAHLLARLLSGASTHVDIAGPVPGSLSLGRTRAWAAQSDARLKASSVDHANPAIPMRIDPTRLNMSAAGDRLAAAGTPRAADAAAE